MERNGGGDLEGMVVRQDTLETVGVGHELRRMRLLGS